VSANSDLAGGRLTINLAALVSNWRYLAKQAGSAECAAVVKANAYGCGIEPVVEALAAAGCKTFFVALPEEGLRVKKTAPSSRCFVLNGLFEDAAPYYLSSGLLPILGSVPEIDVWHSLARKTGTTLPCALHMDSGMNRLGLTLQELENAVGDQQLMQHLDVQLLMTHYACADDIGHPKTLMQREVFKQAASLLPDIALSAANSGANLQNDGHAFDMVRSGIALYGGEALNNIANPMRQVAKLEARIVQIRNANAGDSVGYGGAETLKRDSRIAYVSVGYADGYQRGASNMGVPMRAIAPAANAAYGTTILKGMGRISMDLCGFDVTDIPEDEISAGDWIELFGDIIHIDDVARAAGTISYEFLTGLGNRYARRYVNIDGQS